MKRFNVSTVGRTLLIAAALMVGALWLSGCGEDIKGPDVYGDEGDDGGGGGGNGSYESVTINGQKWMKKNLNIATTESRCYGDGFQVSIGRNENGDWIYRTLSSSEIQTNCNKYGRLYSWAAAKAACQSIGWRLPSNQEWQSLVDYAGGDAVAGKKLKARSGWDNSGNGTDEYGFSALPGGEQEEDGEFHFAGETGIWWTATEDSDYAGYYYVRAMFNENDIVRERPISYPEGGVGGFSVRCVQ
ncbi:hypothetical protein R80B4_02889 [Fibrobacteres bacterium R8-0-B4]